MKRRPLLFCHHQRRWVEVGDAEQAALLAIAEAGNGEYVKASSDLSHAQTISRRLEAGGHLSADERKWVDNSIERHFADVTTYAWHFEIDSGRALFVEGWDTSIDISRESFDAWRESYQQQVDDDE